MKSKLSQKMMNVYKGKNRPASANVKKDGRPIGMTRKKKGSSAMASDQFAAFDQITEGVPTDTDISIRHNNILDRAGDETEEEMAELDRLGIFNYSVADDDQLSVVSFSSEQSSTVAAPGRYVPLRASNQPANPKGQMFMPRSVQNQPKREAISYYDNYITESTVEPETVSRENVKSFRGQN